MCRCAGILLGLIFCLDDRRTVPGLGFSGVQLGLLPGWLFFGWFSGVRLGLRPGWLSFGWFVGISWIGFAITGLQYSRILSILLLRILRISRISLVPRICRGRWELVRLGTCYFCLWRLVWWRLRRVCLGSICPHPSKRIQRKDLYCRFSKDENQQD
jgi:hypothetical protein